MGFCRFSVLIFNYEEQECGVFDCRDCGFVGLVIGSFLIMAVTNVNLLRLRKI